MSEIADTELIQIIVNGETRSIPKGLQLDQLLELLEIPLNRVAVERNRSIVRKTDWTATPVDSGDQLEVVWFVGGGSDEERSEESARDAANQLARLGGSAPDIKPIPRRKAELQEREIEEVLDEPTDSFFTSAPSRHA